MNMEGTRSVFVPFKNMKSVFFRLCHIWCRKDGISTIFLIVFELSKIWEFY